MVFVAIEGLRGRDPEVIHRRIREKGRMTPDGSRPVAGWAAADMGRCSRPVEADEVAPRRRWVARRCDPAGFEIVPVTPGKDAAESPNNRL